MTGLLDWDRLHEDLRRRIRRGGPSRLETLPAEPLEQIRSELREIHRVLETSS